MKATVEVQGKTTEVDIDVGSLTLREAVDIQKILGDEGWDAFAAGTIRPIALQAVVTVKLRSTYPDLDPDDVDMELANLDETEDPT